MSEFQDSSDEPEEDRVDELVIRFGNEARAHLADRANPKPLREDFVVADLSPESQTRLMEVIDAQCQWLEKELSLIDGRFEPIATETGEIGGSGCVFPAKDRRASGRKVAIKMFTNRPADGQQEVKALGRLKDVTGIAHLREEHLDQSPPYLVLDWLEAQTLRDRFATTRPSPKEVIRISLALCEILSRIHDCGVIHCDLSQLNVLIGADGTVWLCDFGQACFSETASTQPQGIARGTPDFWSPEQREGRLREISIRTDVYGLGAVMFWLTTGRAPGDQPNLRTVQHRGLRGLIKRCLHDDPLKRHGHLRCVSRRLNFLRLRSRIVAFSLIVIGILFLVMTIWEPMLSRPHVQEQSFRMSEADALERLDVALNNCLQPERRDRGLGQLQDLIANCPHQAIARQARLHQKSFTETVTHSFPGRLFDLTNDGLALIVREDGAELRDLLGGERVIPVHLPSPDWMPRRVTPDGRQVVIVGKPWFEEVLEGGKPIGVAWFEPWALCNTQTGTIQGRPVKLATETIEDLLFTSDGVEASFSVWNPATGSSDLYAALFDFETGTMGKFQREDKDRSPASSLQGFSLEHTRHVGPPANPYDYGGGVAALGGRDVKIRQSTVRATQNATSFNVIDVISGAIIGPTHRVDRGELAAILPGPTLVYSRAGKVFRISLPTD